MHRPMLSRVTWIPPSSSKKLSEVSRYSVMLFGIVPLARALSRMEIFSCVAALIRPWRIALLMAVASNPVVSFHEE